MPDIAGIDDVLQELHENILDPFIRPLVLTPHRLYVAPKGLLLSGPHRCGKTMVAKALAKESGATFFNIAFSDLAAAVRIVELFIADLLTIRVHSSLGSQTILSKHCSPSPVKCSRLSYFSTRRKASYRRGKLYRTRMLSICERTQIFSTSWRLMGLDGEQADRIFIVSTVHLRPALVALSIAFLSAASGTVSSAMVCAF